MRNVIPFLIAIFLLVGQTHLRAQHFFYEQTYPLPKYEVRATWITSVYGLDWPKTRATTPQGIRRQKEELTAILDRLKEANFNTVLFQTRTRGDVLFRSDIEPMNSILTGTTGKDPGYDPLAFAIEECHKRGMECHAWMVTIPLGSKKHQQSLGKLSLTKKKPAICVPYRTEYFLNPGHPETKQYLFSLVKEVVTKYDVDGVHFDYLRYPEHARKFADQATFKKYGKGRTLEQWRKDNLTEILRYLYTEVKKIKPWVKVSTSPIGKYRDTSRYSSKGFNAYDIVHQDVQGWLAEGIQDQIYPMMYFRENAFFPFLLDWQEQSNGRHVIPGLGTYFLDPKEGNWKINEIVRQLNFIREKNVPGMAHYRVQHVLNNTQGVYDLLQDAYYQAPALQPAMTWLDNTPPSAPKRLKVKHESDGYIRLTWEASTDNDKRNAPRYVIYASDTYPVDTNDPRHIVAQGVTGTEYVYVPLYPWQTKMFFAITAVDRYGNESNCEQ